MMQEVEIGPSTIAQRCSLKSPNYEILTPLDWVVLDFTDGRRSLAQIADIVPADSDAIYKAYLKLRQQGFLTWSSNKTHAAQNSPQPPSHSVKTKVEISPELRRAAEAYLSPQSLTNFQSFNPTLYDESLDIEPEIQIFVEFLITHLEQLTAQEILGLPNAALDGEKIKNAYLARTKSFHPDRYFRKNVGPYANILATLFKASARAFAALSTK